MAARDVERDHHPVARFEVVDLGADLLDDAHRLVPEDVALVDERAEHLVEMQIGSAEPRGRDLDDRVGRLLEPRVGYFVDAHVAPSMPSNCLHFAITPSWVACRSGTPGSPR